MAYNKRTVQIVEMDIDTCTRTWGSAPCLAAFSLNTVRKCYNSFQTCSFTSAYDKSVLTLKRHFLVVHP